ncbi:MAG TPA: tripartite tricarboxylate transporter substrate binding protein [Burkholderiaceae bacterium]|jgi:tripartite-type tricarboxylate transporter receptor subunit TctC
MFPRSIRAALASACLASFTALLCAFTATASADDYPSKLITIVVPYPAGGGLDVTARILAKGLSDSMGQPVIVENRPGAGGSTGSGAVAHAAPDGYTLLLANPGPNAINPSVYARLPYDAEKDFAPISLVTSLPVLFCVGADSPIKSMQDLVAAARKSGPAMTFGSSGNGSLSHLTGEMLNSAAGANLLHVPYRGASPLTLALISNEIQVGLLSGLDAKAQIDAKKIRAIAQGSARRSPIFPNVPTMAESGFPDFDIDIWYGLVAPAKTPAPIIERLRAELAKLLADPQIKARFLELASIPTPSTPQQFASVIHADLARYAKIAKSRGIKID